MAMGPALIGRTLGGRFRVTGFIGEGAMACVYRGVQDGEPRDVAIKVMHPHLLTDRTFVGRFRREAKAAAQILHPNSVRIIETGVDEKLLYIAMELLAGQDLFEILSVERRFSERRAAKVLIQVCAALSAAHEQGIVHRDLKPENVMVIKDKGGADEHVKVLDFGIAKILEPELADADGAPLSGNSLTALTNVGMVVGTPAYMSPEQCRGETIDARSDVYACGILLYQLVTGRLPFSGTTAMDYAVMHVRTEPTPPREIVAGIHSELEKTLLKALGKWPTMRQESAQAFGAELERVLPELADKPFEDQRFSVDKLSLTGPEPELLRHQTPEPVTMRGKSETPSEVYRTLSSERRVAEAASRGSRADTIETQVSSVRRPPLPSEDAPTPAGEDRPATITTELPPSSSFEVFARPRLDEGDDDATRKHVAVRDSLPEEDAPTPLSRSIPTSAKPLPKLYDEPSTPPRAKIAGTASIKKTSKAEIRRGKEKETWLLVPIALALGLALGTAIFYLMR
jgi:serine/threonine protein kinase